MTHTSDERGHKIFPIPSQISSPGFHNNPEALEFIRTDEVALWLDDNGEAWHCCKLSREKKHFGCFIHGATGAQPLRNHHNFKGFEFLKTLKMQVHRSGTSYHTPSLQILPQLRSQNPSCTWL